MDTIDRLNWRYAVKEFDTDKEISSEKIDRLKESVRLTASSLGLQHYRLIVVESSEMKKKLVPASMGQKNIETASHIFVLAAVTNLDKDYVAEYVDRIEKVREVSRESAEQYGDRIQWFIDNSSDKCAWSDKQAYIALGNLLTTAAIEEVDTCPIEGFDNAEYDKILGLADKNLRSVVVCALGYRSSNDKNQHLKKIRLPMDQFSLIF